MDDRVDDRIADVMAQYDLKKYRIRRVKGVWLVETDQGVKSLGSCGYSENKVAFEQKIKQYVKEQGFDRIDLFVPNREQKFLVQGPYNEMFVMRDWFLGEECNVKNRDEVLLAVETLAKLHSCMKGIELSEEELGFCRQPKLTGVLEKRNKELRHVKTYIRNRKQKTKFEQQFLLQFEQLYTQAKEATQLLEKEEYEAYYEKAIKEGSMLHGNFTHHSVIVVSEQTMAVTGFDKAEAGIQILDFYQFFRKMMEKWDWDTALGEAMLETYDRVRTLPNEEKMLLKILLLYPEKFWKVANQYYNNRKSWIPEKNMQKLLQTMEQVEKKKESIDRLFT